METVFQIDEAEIASERIGTGENSALLFWEASEGGVGVLKGCDGTKYPVPCRGCCIERCHFDPETLEDKESQKLFPCLLRVPAFLQQSAGLPENRPAPAPDAPFTVEQSNVI